MTLAPYRSFPGAALRGPFSFDNECALHSRLPMTGHRAIERVFARPEIERQHVAAAIEGGRRTEIGAVCSPLNGEVVTDRGHVGEVDRDLTGLPGARGDFQSWQPRVWSRPVP